MHNVRSLLSFKVICTALMLSVFAISSATPPSINRQYVVNEGIAIYKLKNIRDAFNGFNPSTKPKEVIDTLLEVRQLVFQQTGNSISIIDALTVAKGKMKDKGHRLSKSQWKSLEKLIEKREKKFTTKLFHIELMNSLGQEFNEADFESLFEKTYGKDSDDKGEISLEVTIGVTLVLAGIYMMTIPIPFCQTAGIYFMDAGFCFLGSEGWPYIKDFAEGK